MAHSYTTVRELLKKLEGVHPSTRVLVPSEDHSYRDCDVDVGTALYDRQAGWSVDYGEEATPEAECGKRVPAVIIT